MGNLIDGGGIVGYVSLECYDCDGTLRWRDEGHNIITTTGDNYYATKAIVGIAPHSISAPSPALCMKLGSASSPTTDGKTGAGAGIETYVSGSNKAFDTGNPSVSGNVVTYVTTFAPTEGTSTTLSNIAICFTNNDATSASGDCIARKVISPQRNKQLGDTLIATWTHTFTGS